MHSSPLTFLHLLIFAKSIQCLQYSPGEKEQSERLSVYACDRFMEACTWNTHTHIHMAHTHTRMHMTQRIHSYTHDTIAYIHDTHIQTRGTHIHSYT